MTVTRVRTTPAARDQYNDPDPSPTVDELVLDQAFVAPRTTSDIDDRGRQGVIVGMSLYAPVGTDLVHTDQVKVDGVLYDLDGEMGVWTNPLTGWDAGIEAAIKRAAG